MNGVFFSEGLDMDNDKVLGIEKKVKAQVDSLNKIGNIRHINVPLNSDDKIDRLKFVFPILKSKRETNRNILLDYIDSTVDYIYIRKPSLTIEFYKLLKIIKNKYRNIVIIMEIPTYPFHAEYQGFAKIMAIKSAQCEKKLFEVVDYIVTYSDDKMIWNIPCLRTSNCVDYASIPVRDNSYSLVNNTIRLTCVANYTYWHGADRLVKAVRDYKGPYLIIFNIVGGGKELDNLRILAEDHENIIFHGPKSGAELTEIFNHTDIAVDALGRHRSGVFYNSSLKGKEYVARGLPVISAVKTELDYLKDFNYYLKLPANDSDVDLESVIQFYERIYKDDDANVSEIIRTVTERKFDYKYGFEIPIKKVIEDRKKRNKV